MRSDSEGRVQPEGAHDSHGHGHGNSNSSGDADNRSSSPPETWTACFCRYFTLCAQSCVRHETRKAVRAAGGKRPRKV
jgi:hypothetical protein|eukprot:gene12480-8920_t